MELDRAARKTPEINPLDITNDEKQKEKRRADQFFSSLLGTVSVKSGGIARAIDSEFGVTCQVVSPSLTYPLVGTITKDSTINGDRHRFEDRIGILLKSVSPEESMNRKIVKTIALGTFALVVVLGAWWQARAQDANLLNS